ncbi:hypothetical protein JOD97_002559 [Duganella sp. 1411]|jgi:hypothetical protein|uniref:hypothetical protein n=1 Tax=Duganella sp. 1411 TaxID=2806572 RepID=UPI001AE97782|nr:hypothetical protein [Duganella sp. 1411]MBP1204517.1 hypothetical protein [Duganella sp. 1411]
MKKLNVPAKFALTVVLTAAAVTGCKKQDADPFTPQAKTEAAQDTGYITPPMPANKMPPPEPSAPAAPLPMPESDIPAGR